MNIVAVIQARMGSTRLPGKVLLPLAGVPVIDHVIARLHAADVFDEVVVATSTLPGDDVLAGHVEQGGVRVFRGSEQDVLSRYLLAARVTGATHMMRITADCPLVDPLLMQRMVGTVKASAEAIDLLTNARIRTYPRGLDAELVRTDALLRADRNADQEDREHVTRYLYRRPEGFRIEDVLGPEDMSDLRWTLDEEPDYRLLSAIFAAGEAAGRAGGPSISTVLAMYETNPHWRQINADVQQKKDLSRTIGQAKEQQ
jgi:spore coat polysaccharide biosynthesis protein SpsF